MLKCYLYATPGYIIGSTGHTSPQVRATYAQSAVAHLSSSLRSPSVLLLPPRTNCSRNSQHNATTNEFIATTAPKPRQILIYESVQYVNIYVYVAKPLDTSIGYPVLTDLRFRGHWKH